MKRPKLRIFSISLVALLVVISSGLVFGAWYLKRLEDIVTQKFEKPFSSFPSKIYSDSYLLYVGINLRLEDLAVSAYNGQAANLTPKALLPAAEIVSVE